MTRIEKFPNRNITHIFNDEDTMNSYSDVLLQIKRGFLIVGLTGYTGTGCSTVMKLFEKNDKLKYPGLSSLKYEVDEKRHSKLGKAWNTTLWEPFVSIEVAKVIFMFAIHRAVHCDSENDYLTKIRDIVKNDHQKFECLVLLIIDEPVLSNKDKLSSALRFLLRVLFGTLNY